MRAVLLDTAGTQRRQPVWRCTGAVILAAHGWYWPDPLVALVLAVVIGVHAVHLLHRTTLRLRQSACAGGAEPGQPVDSAARASRMP